jgi:hypothetical protein
MVGEEEYARSAGRMILTGGNHSTWRKTTVIVALCPPQIPHGLASCVMIIFGVQQNPFNTLNNIKSH